MADPQRPAPARRMPLRAPRVAEAVAGHLRLRILDGDLADGSELPPEAGLLREYPVSRPSLREAIRILETEGLLTVRRGKVGGIVVHGPTPRSAAYHMGLLLHGRAVATSDLATARTLLEPLCAEQAARREDHRAVGERLRHLNDGAAAVVDDGPAFTGAAVTFHDALVDAAGNQTLRIVAGMLENIRSVQGRGRALPAADGPGRPSVELRHAALRAHGAIVGAIETGDPELAGTLTRAHLSAASGAAPVRILDEYGMPRLDHDAS